MEIKFNQAANSEKPCFSEEITGYFLISAKWSMLRDAYITFVRKNAMAYCYNLNWAGPLTKFEIDRISKANDVIIVSHEIIKDYLVCINNVLVLPNSPELRKALGLHGADFFLAN